MGAVSDVRSDPIGVAKFAGVSLVDLGSSPNLSLATCWCRFLLVSNCQPMSRLDQLQYPQLRIQGLLTALFSGSGFKRLVANGDVQMGQSKQFLEHLRLNQLSRSIVQMGMVTAYLPWSLAFQYTQWHLEKAARAVPTHYLLCSTTWTSYLLAVFTV